MKSLTFILGLIAAVTIGIGPALFILVLALIGKFIYRVFQPKHDLFGIPHEYWDFS